MSNNNIHQTYHDFCKTFTRSNTDGEAKWRYLGYDLIRRVESWVKLHPKDSWASNCDDDVFCSSIILVIESKTKSDYMGANVIFISQHKVPTEFFLYPGHQRQLAAILSKLRPLSDPSLL